MAPTPSEAAFRSVPLPPVLEGLAAGELVVGATPVLEFTGPVDAALADSPTLRLGLNLEGLRRAERRTLTRLTLSLAAALALGMVMFAFVVLRQQFGDPLRETCARRSGPAQAGPARGDGRAGVDGGARGAQPAQRDWHDGAAPATGVPRPGPGGVQPTTRRS